MAAPSPALLPQPRIHGATASGASSKSALSKRICRSRSGNMTHSRDRVRFVCLGDKNIECWYVCVPPDQHRNAAEALQRGRIHLPHRIADGPVVGVDENLLPPDSSGRM